MQAAQPQSRLKGQIKLYRDLFHEETPVIELSDPKESRNECMMYYYYFTGRKSKKYYEELIKETAKSFFLAQHTVYNIINANGDKIALIKQEWKEKPIEDLQQYLIKEWPQYRWE